MSKINFIFAKNLSKINMNQTENKKNLITFRIMLETMKEIMKIPIRKQLNLSQL